MLQIIFPDSQHARFIIYDIKDNLLSQIQILCSHIHWRQL